MKLIRGLDNLTTRYPHPVLTIGNFDGVHLGHRALFDVVKQDAAAAGGTSMVLTFEPHPIRVLSTEKGPPLITLYEQKIELIQSMGLEVVICLDFTPELAGVEAEDFVRDILVDRIGVKEVVIGYDYTFGRGARGNRDLLLKMGQELGFAVKTVGPQTAPDGQVISSTRIRELVQAGRLEEAPGLLGRYYRVAGQVIRGRDRGARLLGFPTANLRLVDELIPKNGVYAVRVHYGEQTLDGVANIGFNPTFGEVALSVEVHCFDTQVDLYDQVIKVDFIARLRGEKKFAGPDELAAQIRADCELARRILDQAPGNSQAGAS